MSWRCILGSVPNQGIDNSKIRNNIIYSFIGGGCNPVSLIILICLKRLLTD